MKKYEVLEIVGTPSTSGRWKGRDRWIYRFYESDDIYVKEVHFSGGKVVYSGDPIKPKISATEKDKQNAQSNSALAMKIEEDKKKKKQVDDTLRDTKKLMSIQTEDDEMPPQFEPIE